MAVGMVVVTEAAMVGGTAVEGGDGETGVGTVTPIGIGMVIHIGVGEDLRQGIFLVLP